MNIASDVISDITSSFRHDVSVDVLSHVSEWVRDFYAMDSSVLTGDINERYDMLDSLGRSYLQGYISGLNHEFSTRTVIDEESDGAKSQTFAKFRAGYGDTYPSFLLALVAQFINKQTPSDYETPIRQVTVNEDGDEVVYENDVESGKRLLFRMAVAFADGLCNGIDKNRKLTHGYVKVIDDTLSHSLSYQAGREVSMSVTRWKPDGGEVDPFGTEITISDVIMGLFDNTRDPADDDNAKDDCEETDATAAASRSSHDGEGDDGGSDGEALDGGSSDVTKQTGDATDAEDDSSQLQLNLSTDEIVDICDDDWVTYGYDIAKDSVRKAVPIVRAAYSFDDDETLNAIAALCLRKTVSVCFEYIAQRTRRYYDEDETAQRMMLVGYACSYMGQAIDELRGEHLLFESGEVDTPEFDMTPFPQSTLDMIREYKFKYDYPDWIYDCARASMSTALDEVLNESGADGDGDSSDDESASAYLIPADSDYYMMVAFGSMDGIFDLWCETAFKSDSKKRPIYDILGAPMPDDEKEAQREQMREHMRNRERMRRIREARRERRKRSVKETGAAHKVAFVGNGGTEHADVSVASEHPTDAPRRKRRRSLKPKRNDHGGRTDEDK